MKSTRTVSKNKTSKDKQTKPKILNQKPKWQYSFATKNYEMTQIKDGVKYYVELDHKTFCRMMEECVNTFERSEWLTKNNKPLQNVK